MRLWKLGKRKTTSFIKYPILNRNSENETLHIYRALLRQCTYLPDAAARLCLRTHVVSRFRAYYPRRILSVASKHKRPPRLAEQRRPALLKTARKGLTFLRRANDGYPQHLAKVLAMAYGRIGKRRHQLLQRLKIPDMPVDQTALEKLRSDPGSQGVPLPSQQLMTLVKSQAKRKIVTMSRSTTPLKIAPTIPEKNVWGRPMPVKRVRNLKRRWYAQTLDRIMPPLPEAEWNELRKLASGETRWEGPARRRSQSEADNAGHDTSRRGRVKGLVNSPHDITPRYMRRLWTKILAQCPTMKPHAMRKSGWEVSWGEVQDTQTIALQPSGRRDFAMFEGVDERGRLAH